MVYCLFFYAITARKMKISKNDTKGTCRYHHFTQVHHKWQSWYMVPEIWCVTDVIVAFHFGLFFCHFTPLTVQQMEIWKKWKTNAWRYHHITQVYHKHYDHMLYCSWDMVCDGCNCYFSFGGIFCPFTPVTAQKIKISKK